MASMNNWLGFSLSPQEHSLSAEEADCYGSNSTLRPDGSFSILEAFNRAPNDWSMKSLDFKGSTSELSMIVDSSGGKCGNIEDVVVDQPKLEDFLGGGHSFTDHEPKIGSFAGDHYLYTNCSLHVSEIASGGGGNGSIGLSMIKTWLRNQPAPSGPMMEGKESGDDVGIIGRGGPSQSLALSMSTGSQSNSTLQLGAVGMAGGGNGGGESLLLENEDKVGGSCGKIDAHDGAVEALPRKSIDTFGQRTSIYRGVTRHRWTGRYEAHLWDNSCRREGQTRKGRQVYLGGYDKEEKAAKAYDLAALKYWGTTTTTNFPISNYEKELDEMKHMTRQEYVASLRRKSSGFSRGASIYRGVTRHHQHGRWQARIGRVAGNKDLYLGTFSTQEEAAEAYDIAAIKFRGLNAVTNFDMSRYDVKSILESSTLPIGGAAKRIKDVSNHSESSIDGQRSDDSSTSIAIASHLREAALTGYSTQYYGWPTMTFQQQQHIGLHYPYAVGAVSQQRGWCKSEPDVTLGHGDQDMQQEVHLGSTTHNFFQPQGFHNFGMESLAEQSGGSSSSMMNGGSGYVIPMSTMMVDRSQVVGSGNGGGYGDNEANNTLGYDNILGASDPYYGRNIYYSSSITKENGYDHGNGWMVNSAPTVGPRPGGGMSNYHAAPLFTLWNDG